MDYFPRKSLSKYLKDTIDFNKHDINIFINDKWRKYAGGDIGRLFKITRNKIKIYVKMINLISFDF
jgi:hypothetical protein